MTTMISNECYSVIDRITNYHRNGALVITITDELRFAIVFDAQCQKQKWIVRTQAHLIDGVPVELNAANEIPYIVYSFQNFAIILNVKK